MSNKIKEAYDKIHAEEDLKKKTREIVAKRIQKKQGFFAGKIVPILCTTVLAIGLGAGGIWFHTPVSAISVEADSSVQLKLNSMGKVIEVKSYDALGNQLADSVNVKYKNYQEALDEVVSNDKLCSNQDEEILITVSGEDPVKCDEILKQVEQCDTVINGNTCCQWADASIVEAAENAGMTPGKYRAYLELLQYDSELSIEEAAEMTMKEIKQCLREFQQDTQPEEQLETNSGNGFLHNHGNGGNHASNKQMQHKKQHASGKRHGK